MISRLKSLELQGYKTFANKTVFEFPRPITAIVGPNGSGKSNIADALRWVLGEQSFSLLRGKKTEDMIFAGSEQRHRAGMASATIVFDNHDHWLPIDFEEVAISRRAYRDGSNEYLINGHKVRLRDVSELLGKSGLAERTYTIIGQGLVDAALALKAEERRKLFEEAAGIGVYRSRREEAIRRLEQTQRNLQRVEDILAELKPRLHSLEKQAQRAREYNIVKDELHAILREWYGYHWHKSQKELARALDVARLQDRSLEEARRRQVEIDAKVIEKRDQIQKLRARLEDWHRESAGLHARREEISRDLAVASERQRYLSQQMQENELNIASIKEEIEVLNTRISNEDEAIKQKEDDLCELIAQRKKLSESLQRIINQQMTLEQSLELKRQSYFNLIKELSEKQARVQELGQNKRVSQERLDQLQATVVTLETQEKKITQNIVEEERKLKKISDKIQGISSKIEGLEAQLQQLQARRHQSVAVLGEEKTELARLRAQLDVLKEAENTLIGFETGARILVEAARESRLNNLHGVLGLSIEVPEEYQKAIAASLGEFLEAVLLADKSAIEHALVILEEESAKSVILPLSELLPVDSLDITEVAGEALVPASEVVTVSKEIETAIRLLLGSTFIVKDRSTARRVISKLRENYRLPHIPDIRIVTLRGEMFFLHGPVRTEGKRGDELFARKREKRSLGERIEQLERTISRNEVSLTQIDSDIESLNRQIASLTEELRSLQKRETDSQRIVQEEVKKLSAIQQQLNWDRAMMESLIKEITLCEGNLATDTLQVDELIRQSEAIQDEMEFLRREIRNLIISDIQEDLVQVKTREALIEQAVAARRERKKEFELNLSEAQKLLEEKGSELNKISQNLIELAQEIEELRRLENEYASKLSAMTEQIRPAEKELEELETSLQQLQAEEITARKILSQVEHAYAQARIVLTRQQESLNNLRRRIEDDFGLVAFEYANEISGPNPLPLVGLVEQLPMIETLSPTIEEALRRQKALLRRIGPVNPEAEKEYEEVKSRYEFMQSQLSDLQQAQLDVRRVIDELDEIMERDFQNTFNAVADEFHRIFTRLFGGGTAKLMMTDPDDPTGTGIDIEAKLPGRREQGLSLLSGGERSLTAVALVFALLRISPTPFCVLDEVDAMLDEANVSRFGELLRELSQTTQFLIITHNRATVQLADVIYGVTMGRDSTSQTLSLKMDEVGQVL